MGDMMRIKGRFEFYKGFFPGTFKRDLIALPLASRLKPFKWTCRIAGGLYRHVADIEGKFLKDGGVKGGREVIISVVDQDTREPDRIFFDFDLKDDKFNGLVKQLKGSIDEGDATTSKDLQEKVKDHVLSSKNIRRCFDDVMDVKNYFKEYHGVDGVVFFSGAKGFHLYIPLQPREWEHYNKALHTLGGLIKERLGASMDLAVCKDALVRKARVPYTMNLKTGLYCVPVVNDDLDRALGDAEKPEEAPDGFTFPKPSSSLDDVLCKCEEVVIGDETLRLKKEKAMIIEYRATDSASKDLRETFRGILGDPSRSGENYDQYHCPFPTHDDTNPSFTVWDSYWKCYGCLREGPSLEAFRRAYEKSINY